MGYMTKDDGIQQYNFPPPIIKEKSAVMCPICNFPANLHSSGVYVCQNNVNHVGDVYTGLFDDLTPPAGEALLKAKITLRKMHKTSIHSLFENFVFAGDKHQGKIIDHILPMGEDDFGNMVMVPMKSNAAKGLVHKTILKNPRSAWGKKMKEKLLQKNS